MFVVNQLKLPNQSIRSVIDSIKNMIFLHIEKVNPFLITTVYNTPYLKVILNLFNTFQRSYPLWPPPILETPEMKEIERCKLRGRAARSTAR